MHWYLCTCWVCFATSPSATHLQHCLLTTSALTSSATLAPLALSACAFGICCLFNSLTPLALCLHYTPPRCQHCGVYCSPLTRHRSGRLAHGPADAILPLTVSFFSKIQIGLPFWYRLTRVVLEKGPLNGCVCVCVYTCQISSPGMKPFWSL